MPQNIAVFTDPRYRFLLEYSGGAIFFILVVLCTCFFLIHFRKLRRMAKKIQASVGVYNTFLLFTGYFFYTLLAFLCTTLFTGIPLVGAVYLGVWLSRAENLFLPLFAGALIFALVVGFYGTFRFLRARLIYTESKTVFVSPEFQSS